MVVTFASNLFVAAVLSAACLGGAVRADQPGSAVSKCAAVGQASAQTVVFDTRDNDDKPVPVRGLLSKPPGQGPHRAIVMLHRSFGIVPPDCNSTGRKIFDDLGYAVLLVDSDSVRHLGRGENYSIDGYTFDHQARDAVMAHAYLSGFDFVDKSRIALVGYAFGGTSALNVISRSQHRDSEYGDRFRAVAAWHPHCPARLENQRAPLMIIAGGNDTMNWPHRRCPNMSRAGPSRSEYEYVVLPGKRHNFDALWWRDYDAAATAHAYERLVAFLDKHL